VTPNLTLCVLVGVLFAVGVYLLLARSVSRSLLGLLLLGNGANILFMVAGGPAGRAPIVGGTDPAEMSDPLPQAMVLTAIVISLGTVAFVLALANRSWQLDRSDDVTDDPEDRRIGDKAAADDMSGSDHAGDDDESGESAARRVPRQGADDGAARAARAARGQDGVG
jgi:multicomponent Na+:H+ antiporter subunit C